MGGLIMFICMAAGEIFVDSKMFNGFLQRPKIWPMIFVESAVWLIPFMIVVLPVLRKLKNLAAVKSALYIFGLWLTVGVLVIVGYKQTYYSGGWDLKQLARADITFGWTIPCVLILALFIYFSMQYLRVLKAHSTKT
jgi:hypothetical protein